MNMNAAALFLLVLVTGLANGQLNFEGNPLTEDTEYTAMESRLSEGTVRREETAMNLTDNLAESSPDLRLPLTQNKNASAYANPIKTLVDYSHVEEQGNLLPTAAQEKTVVETARHLSGNTYDQGSVSLNHAEVALNSFLNSKTPEESRMSLDHYLQSRGTAQNVQAMVVNPKQLTQEAVPVAVTQPTVSSPVNQHLTAQLAQQRQPLQDFPVNQPAYHTAVNLPDLSSTVSNPGATSLVQQQMLQPYATPIQARNDVFYPGWYQRMRRVRGKPFNYAQSRVGPGFYGGLAGPPAFPLKPKGPPVEVIYTKPPGFHRGPPPVSNPPVPYEDASAWFPDADQPPPSKDVFYSQLYTQSYDPHYYNYIAKTGKIKPHLYGKLGKYHEQEGDGIWSELYRGFKKHGLKNMMTPTFLLGMTLPVITLMLTALVQKRSMARSDSMSREFSQEDKMQEYLEQIQRAMECYEKRRRKRDADTDECWS